MSTMKAMGGAAFSAVATGGSIAANVMGGPMAGYAVSAGMSALRSGVSGSTTGSSGDGSIADQAGQTAAANADNAKQATMSNIQQSGLDQTDLINLQMAMNSQSQAFNTLTNVQKSRHDAAMAAIQNTR
ncbi:MAG TPA: hypothetical protein VHF22_13410 [Planctomycetota bacterium]|nr:hypothetical protein [Planctomycetota bacterium]